jgi:saccharopine dehydrogenase-like NADP-dependent oxidoreductase
VRILVVGTGGVGSAFAKIATRRSFFEHCALADYDPARPERLVAELDDGRFHARAIDASSRDAVVALIRETRADAVLSSVDPLFNVPIFVACFEAGITYLDMAMTLSEPHPTNPYEEVGVKLGDYQFERADAWEEKGLLALVGIGSSPAQLTSSPATRRTSSSRRSTRSGFATEPTSRSRATTSRRPSPSGRRSRSA